MNEHNPAEVLPQEALPQITIHYCRQCQWLLRSAWYAQELLSTFSEELGGVTLRPGSGGVFQITVNGTTIWDRRQQSGFPEAKQLKQLVRDAICPKKPLGHNEPKS